MLVDKFEVDDKLIKDYVKSIIICHKYPTKESDSDRRKIHNMIFDSIQVDRCNYEFADALDTLIQELIKL